MYIAGALLCFIDDLPLQIVIFSDFAELSWFLTPISLVFFDIIYIYVFTVSN